MEVSAGEPLVNHKEPRKWRWFGRRGETIALLLLAVLCGFPRFVAAQSPRPNLIVITIDTLRADHLHCYGDSHIQTPNIDALAHVGARFTQAYSAVPITLPSHTVIFTGAYPMATGIHDFSENKLSPKFPTLATVAREHGYTTAAFIASAVLDRRFGLNQGFDTYFDHFNFNRLEESNLDLMSRPGNEVMDNVLAWLQVNPPQPFFLWVHLYDAHFPYTPPQPYASRYRGHPYDGEIAFDDAQVGRLFNFLRSEGIFKSSVIALMADHGEGLGEHGEKTHGYFIYNSTLHVPLIIKVPGAKPRVIHDEVSLADVMPTLLQALKLPIPPTVQGRGLLSEILGQPPHGHSILYSESYLPLLHFHWSQLRGYQSRGMKYIDAPRPELYDLKTDPHELKNLYHSRRAMAQGMHNELFSLLRRLTPTSGNAEAQKTLTDPVLLARLQSLGYVAVSAGTYADTSGKALPDPKDRIKVYELVSDGMYDGQHGRYEESLAKLHEAAKTDPDSVPINYLMAIDYYHRQDYSRAVTAFRRVLQLDPKYAMAAYFLGLTEIKTGDLEDAEKSFQRALDLDPSNFSAAYNLGAIYWRQKRVEEALENFQRAARIYPQDAKAFQAQGEIYLYLHKFPEAVEALQQVVKLQPDNRKAHYNLGRAYQAMGKSAAARQEFQRAQGP